MVAKIVGAGFDVPRHPAQIYEIFATGCLMVFLFWYRPRRRFRGEIALLYLTISPILRFVTEFFRGDPKRGWFMKDQLGEVLSKPQGVAIGMLCVMAVAWYVVPRLPGANELSTRGTYGGAPDEDAVDDSDSEPDGAQDG